tara:strand:+ start:73 stop:534 length:462 start_codon:yes stop_codon:yes gene_type:complete
MSRYKTTAIVLGVTLVMGVASIAHPRDFEKREERLETMISRATKEKDIILLNCLRANMADLKKLHPIGTDSLDGAVKARSQENADLEEHYLTKVKIVEEESLRLFTEAILCVGTIPDKTVVRVVVSEPEKLAIEDTEPPHPIETRPPDASPFD